MQNLKAVTEQVFKEHSAGNLDLAEAMYDSIMSQLTVPDFNILYGYGSLLIQRERYGIGITLLQTAASLNDQHPFMWTNLGVAYKQLGHEDLALYAYNKALQVDPNCAEAIASLAGLHINHDEAKLAEAHARRALKISNLPAAHMHLGLALLEQGRFDEAWPHYEHRWDSSDRLKWKRSYQSPKWDGSPVKKLIIHGEQGLGDEILFMSLFQRARERAGEVVIECASRLMPTFSKAFGVRCYATELELRDNEGPEDAHVAMGTLPMLLGLPKGEAFLPRPNKVKTGKPTIGITWRGGTQKTNKDFRTLKIEELRPIVDSCDANFVSVQYGGDYIDDEAKQIGLITGPRDFESLQFRIGTCDLVITVCQTAVHQAGGMGVPCWVLTPRKSAWSFMGESMMPWYASVELFKQKANEDWSSVIQKMAATLKERYADLAA